MQSKDPKQSKVLMKLKSINKFLVCDIEKHECELVEVKPNKLKKSQILSNLALVNEKS